MSNPGRSGSILYEELRIGERAFEVDEDYAEDALSQLEQQRPGVCTVLRIAALRAVCIADERAPKGWMHLASTCLPWQPRDCCEQKALALHSEAQAFAQWICSGRNNG